MTERVRVVICEFGSPTDPRTDPTISGWSTCACGRWVALHGAEAAQVTAGTLFPMCIICADELAAEHPDIFGPHNHEGSVR